MDYTILKDPATVGPGKKVTPSQKKKMRELNKEQNGGNILSDMDGTKLNKAKRYNKGEKADMKQNEIDHKIPRSEGGSNSYSNLQIISKGQNIKKSNKLGD